MDKNAEASESIQTLFEQDFDQDYEDGEIPDIDDVQEAFNSRLQVSTVEASPTSENATDSPATVIVPQNTNNSNKNLLPSKPVM